MPYSQNGDSAPKELTGKLAQLGLTATQENILADVADCAHKCKEIIRATPWLAPILIITLTPLLANPISPLVLLGSMAIGFTIVKLASIGAEKVIDYRWQYFQEEYGNSASDSLVQYDEIRLWRDRDKSLL
jgi:hypothetical protein